MTQEQLDELVSDPEKLKAQLDAEKPVKNLADILKQYEPSTHDITDQTKRPDKLVTTDAGTSTVTVARLTLNLQKKIAFYAAAFLCANPVKVDAAAADETQQGLLDVIRKTLEDNKVDYKNMQLAEMMMAETEVAELWYTEPLPPDSTVWAGTVNEKKAEFRLRMKVLANSLGDALYPVFNEFGDMIAFGRGYFVGAEGSKSEMLELYTATKIYIYQKTTNGWIELKSAANIVQKIPVIYYRQPKPEWSDVQTLIDRLEISISNHGDTNDYFGSPMVKVKGEVKGFAKKGESGKVIEMSESADADYLTWDQSPDSIKLEQTNLRSFIYDNTDTPDISFTQMSKLGTFSGFAIKLLFMSAHLKAAKKEQTFGEGVQRRLNFLKAAMAKINVTLEKGQVLSVKPKFKYFLPEDTETDVDVLVRAKEGGILSQESAVAANPLVSNPEEELERLKKERDAAAGLDEAINDDVTDPDEE
ncbi:phage portal protein [Flavihumibacter petaseus]|uniref:Putative phage portal protein n=1 Tax=Flavihumibacter petaseus NBRC 106054 TaxID=1220578 RepID=A0A0E9N181_9BACT|nr:phage portal protein [Flavihumibacter petaseus]GAO43787.1 putative phage portal protein [Flavihumibacter petaseus NBRC 106054]